MYCIVGTLAGEMGEMTAVWRFTGGLCADPGKFGLGDMLPSQLVLFSFSHCRKGTEWDLAYPKEVELSLGAATCAPWTCFNHFSFQQAP